MLTGVATVFFYARLWRRSGVMTDLEFYEIRYSGKAASVVRGFRSVYLGLFFNCMIMATVNLAACKIAAILFGCRAGRRCCSSAAERRLRRPLRPLGRAGHRHDPVLHQNDGRDRRRLLRGQARRRAAQPDRNALRQGRARRLNYLNILPDF